MKKTNKEVLEIFIRYLILVIAPLGSLWIFYTIFTPLTVYPVYFLLSAIFEVSLVSNTIILVNQTIPIEIIEACVAGSAYYFLLILNLTTKGIKLKTRIKMILGSFIIFLVINILRIIFLSVLAVRGSPFFDITHILFWYIISTIFVVGIWFYQVKKFKIKQIPLYSDLKLLHGHTKKKK